jgi:hypothetical protein
MDIVWSPVEADSVLKGSSYEIQFHTYKLTCKGKLKTVKYVNFDSFSGIKNPPTQHTAVLNYSKRYFLDVEFIPNMPLILDEALNLTYLTADLNRTMDFCLTFFYTKGVDINLAKFALFKQHRWPNSTLINCVFNFVVFKLYVNGRELGEADCNENIWSVKKQQQRSGNDSFFCNLNNVHFGYCAKYSKKTCKFIFAYSKIKQLTLNSLSDSFIKDHQR